MSGCYCCRRPQHKMDVDAALNELGMLSTVTDSRRQYLQERARRSRNRTQSEQGTSYTSGHLRLAETTGSPSKAFQIVTLNPQYVTSLSSASETHCNSDIYSKTSNESYASTVDGSFNLKTLPMKDPELIKTMSSLHLGTKYKDDNLEFESRRSRLTRVKLERVRRFKRPYDIPWKYAMETRYAIGVQQQEDIVNCNYYSPEQLENTVHLANTAPTSNLKRCSSNSNTPEKLKQEELTSLNRSRSMDDLDPLKFKSAEAENHNYVLQKREIDRMSQHLKNLQVD